MEGKICKCGHKVGYHSKTLPERKYPCRGAFCKCKDFEEDVSVSGDEQ